MENVTFINLTPHPISVVTILDTIITFLPSGAVARVSVNEVEKFTLAHFEFFSQVYGEIENLPEPQANTFYIVSAMVKARTSRADVIAPNTGKSAVRHENGQIKAVRNWII